ncbi:SF1_C_UvrD domain containing protein [Oxalobacteraceae bacterium]
MHWKPDFLKIDDHQRHVIKESVDSIRSKRGNHVIPWISGYAGNGKSVVLVFAMENIADLEPSASIAFITYTHALKDLVKSSLLPKHQQRIHVATHTSFLSDEEHFDYVFVDEIQDLKAAHLKRISDLSGRTVFAGDFAQTIYPDSRPVTQKELTVSFEVQEYKLTKMYRLTKRVAEIVGKLIRSTFSVGLETGLQKEIPIRLFRFESQDEEFAWVWEEAKNYSKAGEPSVILFPHKRLIANFMQHVSNEHGLGPVPKVGSGRDPYASVNHFLKQIPGGVILQYFGKGSGNEALLQARQSRCVLIMTYYSAKGLDFRAVFVPALTKKLWLANEDAIDADPEIEQKVLFVALTRSREALFMTFSGDSPHQFVTDMGLDFLDIESSDY